MPMLYRILGSLALLFIIVTTIVFSFGILFIGATIASLYGIYRYYLGKRKPKSFGKGAWESPRGTSRSHYPREVIDMPTEIIDRTDENYRS